MCTRNKNYASDKASAKSICTTQEKDVLVSYWYITYDGMDHES